MVTKKQRRSFKGKKVYNKGFTIVGAFFFGCLIVLGLFFYLSNSISTTSLPLYEEIYTVTSELKNKIRKIDHIIYESLYKIGIAEKDIFFSAVEPRYEKGYEWDFAELLIELSDRRSALHFLKIINHDLSKFKPDVSFRNEKASDREEICNVFTLGHYTHRIRLIHERYEKRTPKTLPRIAIIIDDLGFDNNMAILFMGLDLPLSLSILPLAPYTKSIAHEANKRGRELLLHLPMEPKGYPNLNPGPGALITDMDEKQIRQIMGDLVKQVPGLRGVNNHMGSYFTERTDKMRVVLSELKRMNLFYVDSRTTNRTVAFKEAKKLGVPVAKKSVFLDNELSSKSIKFQMERLLSIARYSGSAVGIGHPHKETLRVLKEYKDRLESDFKVVHVSELVS